MYDAVDQSRIRAHPPVFCSHTGHPAGDPELLIRIQLVGSRIGKWSELRLCEEGHWDRASRWYCRLELNAEFRITRRLLRTGTCPPRALKMRPPVPETL